MNEHTPYFLLPIHKKGEPPPPRARWWWCCWWCRCIIRVEREREEEEDDGQERERERGMNGRERERRRSKARRRRREKRNPWTPLGFSLYVVTQLPATLNSIKLDAMIAFQGRANTYVNNNKARATRKTRKDL